MSEHDVWAEINALKRRVDRGLDSLGNPKLSGATGTIPVHSHAGAGQGGVVDAAPITYTPSTLSDWLASADPGNVDDALDQLAAEVATLIAGSGSDASGVTYTPADNSDWNSSADPGNVDDGLDQLADRVKALEATFTQRVFFDAQQLKINGGSAQNRGTDPDQTPTIACISNGTSGVMLVWQVPGDWVSGVVTVILHYAKISSGSGNIVHRFNYSILANGDDLGETGTQTDQTIAVPATANQKDTLTLGTFTPGAVGDVVRINYRRPANDAADTYAGGSDVVGIEIRYTSR